MPVHPNPKAQAHPKVHPAVFQSPRGLRIPSDRVHQTDGHRVNQRASPTVSVPTSPMVTTKAPHSLPVHPPVLTKVHPRAVHLAPMSVCSVLASMADRTKAIPMEQTGVPVLQKVPVWDTHNPPAHPNPVPHPTRHHPVSVDL